MNKTPEHSQTSVPFKLFCWLHFLYLRSCFSCFWKVQYFLMCTSPNWCSAPEGTNSSVLAQIHLTQGLSHSAHGQGPHQSPSSAISPCPSDAIRCWSPAPQVDVSALFHLCRHRGTWWSGLGLHGPIRGVSPALPLRVPLTSAVPFKVDRVHLQPYQYWTEWKNYFTSLKKLPFSLGTIMFDFPAAVGHCWLNFNNPQIISCRTAI